MNPQLGCSCSLNICQNASFKEASTLVNLSRTLRLLIAVEDLTSTNKSLRAVWQERETTCLSLVRDLAATKLGVCLYLSLNAD